jgi:hypothetical protein
VYHRIGNVGYHRVKVEVQLDIKVFSRSGVWSAPTSETRRTDASSLVAPSEPTSLSCMYCREGIAVHLQFRALWIIGFGVKRESLQLR